MSEVIAHYLQIIRHRCLNGIEKSMSSRVFANTKKRGAIDLSAKRARRKGEGTQGTQRGGGREPTAGASGREREDLKQ